MAGVALKPGGAFAAMYPNARLIASVAYGADLDADQSSWTWTDVTVRLNQANGQIVIDPMGKADEYNKAQSARCTLILNNPNGEFSKGPQSPNYPNVRANLPLKVEVALDGVTRKTRFFGYITSLEPHDTTTGGTGWVSVVAYGKMHLLEVGDEAVTNILARYHVRAGAIAAWGFDDAPDSFQATSALPNGIPMFGLGFQTFGRVNFGFKVDPAQLPAVPTAALMPVPSEPGTDVFVADIQAPLSGVFILDFWRGQASEPDASETQLYVIDFADPSGFFSTVEIRARMSQSASPGPLVIPAYTVRLPSGQILDSSNGSAVDPFDGKFHNVFVKLAQFGSDVDVELWVDGQVTTTTTFASKTLPALAQRIHIRNNVVNGLGFGNFDAQSMLAIYNTSVSAADSYAVATKLYTGEIDAARLARLSAEDGPGLPIVQRGTSGAVMGPQKPSALVDLLRDCEAVDAGSVLYDGRSQGIEILWRSAKYGQAATLVLDATAQEIAPPFEPKDDDLLDRNLWTIARRDGSTVTVTDKTGPKGTDAVGKKPGKVTDLNLFDDSPLANIGAFYLSLGTVDEPYRYPKLGLNLARLASKAGDWLNTLIGNRVDIVNLRSVSTRHPPGDISLLVEGYSEVLSPNTWTAVVNATPYAPWDAAKLGSSFRLELAGVALAAPLAPGATSFTITVGTGHQPLSLKAAYPADYPSDLKVGGWPIHVTDCTGAAPTQTLTCTATPNTNTIPAGTSITLWRPGRLAL